MVASHGREELLCSTQATTGEQKYKDLKTQDLSDINCCSYFWFLTQVKVEQFSSWTLNTRVPPKQVAILLILKEIFFYYGKIYIT